MATGMSSTTTSHAVRETVEVETGVAGLTSTPLADYRPGSRREALAPCQDKKALGRLLRLMWSFWIAFEHGFDENQLKRAQTRTILTKMRSKLTGFDHFEPRISRGLCIFDPPPHPPFFIKVEYALEIPLFLTF